MGRTIQPIAQLLFTPKRLGTELSKTLARGSWAGKLLAALNLAFLFTRAAVAGRGFVAGGKRAAEVLAAALAPPGLDLAGAALRGLRIGNFFFDLHGPCRWRYPIN